MLICPKPNCHTFQPAKPSNFSSFYAITLHLIRAMLIQQLKSAQTQENTQDHPTNEDKNP